MIWSLESSFLSVWVRAGTSLDSWLWFDECCDGSVWCASARIVCMVLCTCEPMPSLDGRGGLRAVRASWRFGGALWPIGASISTPTCARVEKGFVTSSPPSLVPFALDAAIGTWTARSPARLLSSLCLLVLLGNASGSNMRSGAAVL